MNRLTQRLQQLRAAGRSGLVTYLTAGDPDAATSLALLTRLGAAGADLIELGMPFSDPVADGPTIQAAHLRALASGQTLAATLQLVSRLRQHDQATPLLLMGYLNPLLQYGVEPFMAAAAAAGVDGLLLVDLPFEHAAPYRAAARQHGLQLIAMTAPGSDAARLAHWLPQAEGFVYHVSQWHHRQHRRRQRCPDRPCRPSAHADAAADRTRFRTAHAATAGGTQSPGRSAGGGQCAGGHAGA